MSTTSQYCSQTGCLRRVFKPALYCDKHQDNASTPPPVHAHEFSTPVIFSQPFPASSVAIAICKSCGEFRTTRI